MKVTGKPSLVFLSLVAWQEEMNPPGIKLGWAVAGEDALPPSWGVRNVPLGHWDRGRRFVWMSPKAFEVSLIHSVGEVEGTVVILHPDFQ